jgi:hypothetical protein
MKKSLERRSRMRFFEKFGNCVVLVTVVGCGQGQSTANRSVTSINATTTEIAPSKGTSNQLFLESEISSIPDYALDLLIDDLRLLDSKYALVDGSDMLFTKQIGNRYAADLSVDEKIELLTTTSCALKLFAQALELDLPYEITEDERVLVEKRNLAGNFDCDPQITAKDRLELVEFIHVNPLIDPRIISMKSIDLHTVEITCGSVSGAFYKAQKVNGKWLFRLTAHWAT